MSLHFIGISSPMLAAALEFVPDVRVFDNSSTKAPYQLVLHLEKGGIIFRAEPPPTWLGRLSR